MACSGSTATVATSGEAKFGGVFVVVALKR